MSRHQATNRTLFLAAAALTMLAAAQAHAGGNISLEVTGPMSNLDKLQRCLRVATKNGYTVTAQAPLRVLLVLQPGVNRLQIDSMRRGEVLNAPRPGWGMDQLCEDAIRAAGEALAHEGDPPVGPPRPAGNYRNAPPPPPPSYSPPPMQVYTPPPGSRPTIALDVTGPMSNPGKVERCNRVAERQGFALHPNASVRVLLVLQPGMNRLQVNSMRRGEVLNAPRPGWGVEQLCEDALASARQALAQEGGPPVGGSHPTGAYNAPPPPPRHDARPQPVLALGPIPPGADLPPAARAAADAAVVAWQSSRFEQALAAFRDAGRTHNDPQFLFDQAVCEQRLGRYTEALSHTQLFLDLGRQSPYRPYGEQLYNELQAQLGMPND